MVVSDPLLLGIDVGTTNIKAALCTPTGRVVAQARTPYPTHHLRPGWIEQDPADWWRGLVAMVHQVTAQYRPEQIAGIGISGQGCAVTLIDEAGQVIRPALIWMDIRSEAQCEVLRLTCAEDILRISGKFPAPYNADPKLMWLAEHEPDAIRRARYSLTTTAYINFRLTGECVMNKSDASILFGFDLAEERWSSALIAAFGVPERLYPPVTECRTVIGTLTPDAAQELGLRAGTPVIAGGEDTSSAGLALGVVATGEALLSLGTAGTIYAANARAPGTAITAHPDLLTFLHVIGGVSLTGGSMIAAGAAFEWCRRLLPGDLTFEQLTALASASEAGSGGVIFLPYLNGELQPINDGHARGVFFGLNLGTGPAQLVRATMEGVAYAIAHNLHIARQIGMHIDRIRATGTPARNALWCQVIADVTGHGVEVIPNHGGAPLGDALLCAAALGLIDDPIPIARALNRDSEVFTPNPAAHATYANLFEIFRALYPALRPQFARLHAATYAQ
jgi:xylulokinase